MKTIIIAAAIAILPFVGPGCASVGQKVDQTAVDRIQKGVSTKADVRRLIGDPNKVSKDSSGVETWKYEYAHAQVKGATFIPIVGMFAGGTRTQTQDTEVKFKDGVVSEYTTSYGGTEVTEGPASGTRANISDAEGNRRERAPDPAPRVDAAAPAQPQPAPSAEPAKKVKPRF